MFEEHKNFKPPENPDHSIWRYIDFAKFVDLIITKELYFSRLDLFEDKFEGSNTIPTVKDRESYFKNMVGREIMTPEGADKNKKILDNHYEEQRRHYAVNCWYINEYESAAMWSLYSRTGAGITIKSTYNRLKNALRESPIVIHVGIVKYVDFQRDLTEWGVGFIPILLKRKSFEHEHELRAVIWSQEGENNKYCEKIEHGIRVKINLDELVDSVYLAPFTPQWIHSLVNNIMDKFEFNKALKQSGLEGEPVY